MRICMMCAAKGAFSFAEAASLATGDCARAEQAAKMHRNTVRRFSEPHDATRPTRLARLFESQFTNRSTTAPLALFPQDTLKRIIDVLGEIKQRAGWITRLCRTGYK